MKIPRFQPQNLYPDNNLKTGKSASSGPAPTPPDPGVVTADGKEPSDPPVPKDSSIPPHSARQKEMNELGQLMRFRMEHPKPTSSGQSGHRAEREEFEDFSTVKQLAKGAPKLAVTCSPGTNSDSDLGPNIIMSPEEKDEMTPFGFGPWSKYYYVPQRKG